MVLLLAAAKAHGRQMRVERELRGVFEVTFEPGGQPPWLAKLWADERKQFWTAVPIAALVWGVAGFLVGRTDLALVGAFLWAPTAGLGWLGLASLRRFSRSLDDRIPDATGEPTRRAIVVRAERGAWLSSTLRGSYRWWSIVGGLAFATVAFAALYG